MAETLRELVVALPENSSSFSRNMRCPQPADQGSRVHLPSGRGCSRDDTDHQPGICMDPALFSNPAAVVKLCQTPDGSINSCI